MDIPSKDVPSKDVPSKDHQPALPVTATTTTNSIVVNSLANIHQLSNGCLKNGFLETEDIVKLLTSFLSSDAHDKIPGGIKNNVYFVVKNDDNVERQKKGDLTEFHDDCGVYNSNRGKDPKTYYITNPEGRLQVVYKRGDQFCSEKRIKGKLMYFPMQSQPSIDTVIELNRNYSTLNNDSSYLRRVSWLGGHENHIAVVEYFKGYTQSNQIVANNTDEHIPLNVKTKLVHDESSGLSSSKLVQNQKHIDNNSQDGSAEIRTLSSNSLFLSTGCLNKGFMEVKEVVKWLTSVLYEKAHNSIPDGIKNDVYFLVKNDENVERRKNGVRSRFPDDCKGYDYSTGSTSKNFFITNPEGRLKVVFKKGDKFCYKKVVKGKKIYYPHETQPSSDNVIELFRYYTTLKKDSSCKRRVSWLGGHENHIALVEYSGKFPGLVPHGNSKDTDSIQTRANVMSEMSDMFQDTLSPSMRKQVYDKKHNGNKSWEKNVTKQTPTSTKLTDLQTTSAPSTSDCSTVMRTLSPNIHSLSNGCLNKGFLEAEEIIKKLTSFLYAKAHNSIPDGIKNDVYFVVKNDKNVERRKKGAISNFSDDCGVYNCFRGSTSKSYLVTNPEGRLKAIHKKGDQFCYAKQVKGKKIYYPLDTQPLSDNIIELFRHYSTLKKDSSYKRRVSWLGGHENHIALVEYSGEFPGLVPHGNSKNDKKYVRTPASVMSEMSDLLHQDKPSDVYNKLTLKHNKLSGLISRKQIYDKKHKDKKRQFKLKTKSDVLKEQSSIPENSDTSDEVSSAVYHIIEDNFTKQNTRTTSEKTPQRFGQTNLQTASAPSISESVLEVEKEKLEIEREKLALEKEKIAMKREKLQMEKEKMKMKKRSLELFEEYVTLKKVKFTNAVSEACEVSPVIVTCNY
ncbi:uncharacterized protein LOC127734145 isoform X2 [Mytilus californianus]|nr:uncharacterized protein LOC127734145 isoform X2 [Mytilus californianus]XP_052099806.1 uncharacterized protein LOC127734145 isoform X2 [Mytilus californianus]XP_052099807.1 uncharacterized protein LOC127734145 isoform X2 [Mytilus californianus]